MYKVISQQLIEPAQENRFISSRDSCRYCGTHEISAFGKKTNAHTFPEALGNKVLFSLDECISCNAIFSTYEDALAKAVGPFLTLGGIRGKKGVRQTGRSQSFSKIRHNKIDDQRHISVRAAGVADELIHVDQNSGILKCRMPVEGDRFIPLYAYKALLKMALALLPNDEVKRFQGAVESLRNLNAYPVGEPLWVGFSYAYVGNSPPMLAGTLLRRNDPNAQIPYLIFIFVAGSVCFQIWLRSDQMDDCVPSQGKLGINWTSQLPKPEGGYMPIKYSDPIQFDWSELSLQPQPFSAFDLYFDTNSTEGRLEPILRQTVP